MPSIHDLKQSKFLTKSDVTPAILVTIRGYALVNVAMESEPEEKRYTISFNEVEKPLVLNTTNGNTIASITGSEDFDGWIGKKIVLYNDPNISFGGKLIGGIRVRAPRNQAPAPAPVKAAPAAPPAPVDPAAEPDDGSDVPF